MIRTIAATPAYGIVAASTSCLLAGTFYSFPLLFEELKGPLRLSQLDVAVAGACAYSSVLMCLSLGPFVYPAFPSPHHRHVYFRSSLLAITAAWAILGSATAVSGTFAAVLMAAGATALGVSCGMSYPYEMVTLIMDGRVADVVAGGYASAVFASAGLVATVYLVVLQHAPHLGPLAAMRIFVATFGSVSALFTFAAFAYDTSPPDPSPTLGEDRPLVQPAEGNEPEGPLRTPRQLLSDALAFPLRKVSFALATVVLALKVGIGATAIANIGAVVASAGVTGLDVGWGVVKLMAAQVVGRITLASVSALPLFGQGHGALILVSLGYTALFGWAWLAGGVAAHSVGAYTITLGFLYGIMWTVTSYIPRFAHPVTKDVGDYWQILMSVANPSAIFTTAAFGAATGKLYAAQCRAGENSCDGKHCFRDSFLMLAVASAVLLAASLALTLINTVFQERDDGKRQAHS